MAILVFCFAFGLTSCSKGGTSNNSSQIITEVHVHTFSDATCTEAAKCSCGVTSGEALGHDYKAATCTTPETCTRCGVTNGSVLEHIYKDATCTDPKTCTLCGEKSGEALGHDYKEATCTEAKTCNRCGGTSGKALGHKYDDNISVIILPTYNQAGKYNGVCTRCQKNDTFSIGRLAETPSQTKEEMLRLINAEREKAGVVPLTYNEGAQIAADARALEINMSFSHTRPDGSRCFTVLDDYNLFSGYSLGENIAVGYSAVEAAMNGWMNSPGHKENILSPDFTSVAIGQNEDGWVQIFFG